MTKLNKSAELLFNNTSTKAVGQQIAEFLGTPNNHFLQVVNTLTSRQTPQGADIKSEPSGTESKPDDESGTIGGAKQNVIQPEHMSQQLLGSFVMSTLGKDSKEDSKQE